MSRRGIVYKEIAQRFSFLTDMNLSEEQYQTSSKELVQAYPQDLDCKLETELKQFHTYIRVRRDKDNSQARSHQDLYNIIVVDNIQGVFPNVSIALRIFLCMLITNCSAECSFSQLKHIKNPNRTTMTQERLVSLTRLSIESDLVRSMDFDKNIKDFAFQKSRKKSFQSH